MRALYPGHRYELRDLRGNGTSILQFAQEPPLHSFANGPSCQEVVRVLIDRVQTLDREIPWDGNHTIIIPALRTAMAGFEVRSLLRKAAKGLEIETLAVGPDGHLAFQEAR